MVVDTAVGAVGIPVKAGLAKGALSANAVDVAVDIGLSASDVLSTFVRVEETVIVFKVSSYVFVICRPITKALFMASCDNSASSEGRTFIKGRLTQVYSPFPTFSLFNVVSKPNSAGARTKVEVAH